MLTMTLFSPIVPTTTTIDWLDIQSKRAVERLELRLMDGVTRLYARLYMNFGGLYLYHDDHNLEWFMNLMLSEAPPISQVSRHERATHASH